MSTTSASDGTAGATGDEARAAGRAPREHEWTTERQLAFLEALAQSGNVRAAAASVGMSFASAYRMRGRPSAEAFRFGWKAAQDMAYYRLRDLALERVETGVEMAIIYHGKTIGTRTVYSDRLLVAMLDHLRPAPEAVARSGARRPAVDTGNNYALAVDAFADAIEHDVPPVAPIVDDAFFDPTADPEPVDVISREDFLAAIAPKDYPKDEWNAACGLAPEPAESFAGNMRDPSVTLDTPGPAGPAGDAKAGGYGWPCPPPAPSTLPVV